MTLLPNLSDYMQTFQNPNLFLSDKELVACNCPKDQQGQPKVQSGGFALTFRLESPTKKWAVRCFHREVKDRDRRYTAISAKLNEPAIRQSGYFVDFAYQATGVTVKGKKFPIVKMSWASGVTLGAFLESNYNNPQKLQNLRSSLKCLYQFLAANHIAHGDIQPGNLMVSSDGKNIQLIDYDGMFVPGMESLKAAETGVPNFQHPRRQKESPWNDKLDRFPFIMLDIALSVLAEKPSYWTKTNSSDEKVLFETTDYLAPYGSPTFNELKADAKFSKQISVLQQICLADFSSIPAADNYLQFTASPAFAKKSQQPQIVEISYQGNYSVLDGTNVVAIASREGHVIEIVGKIVETKEDWTRGRGNRSRLPYMFVNFKVWRRGVDTFRLVLWSEVLNQFSAIGVKSVSKRLSGQFVSVTGMVVKYNGRTGTAYQLVPTSPNQIQIIDKTEADYRLGKIKKTLKQNLGGTVSTPSGNSTHCGANKSHATVSTSNKDKLKEIVGQKPSTTSKANKQVPPRPLGSLPSRVTVKTSSSAPTSNAQRLQALQGKWSGTRQTKTTPKQNNSQSTSSQAQPITPTNENDNRGCLWMCLFLVLVSIIMKCCK